MPRVRPAMYDDHCDICKKKIKGQSKPFANDGEEIARFFGKVVHASCKEAEIAARANREATQLPDARGSADRPARMRVRGSYRVADIGKIRARDGRDYQGRFASKPEEGMGS